MVSPFLKATELRIRSCASCPPGSRARKPNGTIARSPAPISTYIVPSSPRLGARSLTPLAPAIRVGRPPR